MIHLEELIARQIHSYEERQRLGKEGQWPGRGSTGGAWFGPYLLISREQGSGGHTVSQLLSRELGWQVFDSELVDEVAKRTNVHRKLLDSLDEHNRTLAEDILIPALNKDDLGRGGYLHHLRQVVLTLGQQGHVIIIGRGAHLLLPRQFGLSLRLTAPLETRVKRLAQEGSRPESEVLHDVKHSDRERANFIKRSFGHDVGDPVDHDIILNTEQLSAAGTAGIVLQALNEKLGVRAITHA